MGDGIEIKLKICEGGQRKKNMWVGVGSAEKKICEGGSANFSIPPLLRISNGIALKSKD